MSVQTLEAIIFDIGGTLVRHAPSGTAVADLTPELIGTAAEDLEQIGLLGASPATTLFVGDDAVDAGAAEAAGTHFAWSDGVRSPGSIVDEILSGRDGHS